MTPQRRVALLLLALGLLASACTGGDEPIPTDSGSPAVNATTAPLLPVTIDALPQIDADTYGELLSQLRGTPVVVNVWAAWCEPCKAEAPLLAGASETHGSEVQFLGVDVLDSRDSGQEFIADYGLTYPSVFDPSGAIQTELDMLGPPGTFFYAADGTLVDAVRGQLSADALEAGIEQIRA
jgi:cytochrome c biogenesis protein CcmG, thiol:disulfide interchange protein DsbE